MGSTCLITSCDLLPAPNMLTDPKFSCICAIILPQNKSWRSEMQCSWESVALTIPRRQPQSYSIVCLLQHEPYHIKLKPLSSQPTESDSSTYTSTVPISLVHRVLCPRPPPWENAVKWDNQPTKINQRTNKRMKVSVFQSVSMCYFCCTRASCIWTLMWSLPFSPDSKAQERFARTLAGQIEFQRQQSPPPPQCIAKQADVRVSCNGIHHQLLEFSLPPCCVEHDRQ